MLLMVNELVSANKLKNDFVKYEKDELKKLSDAELSNYRDSLVLELFKDFKHGAIQGNPDADEINDLIDSYMEIANERYSNAEIVLLDRKFRCIVNAYFTANINTINRVYDLVLAEVSTLVADLIYAKIDLSRLLFIYHDNYSNYGLLNGLFFNLSTYDDLPLTFDIHQKYLDDAEFGVNQKLMRDLDFMIKSTVERILELIERIERLVDVDEISGGDYFDKTADAVKSALKSNLSNISDFEKTALINSGYDNALFHQVENAESEIEVVKIFLDVKEWFMNLYNDNGFAYISADLFDSLKEIAPDIYSDDDFDDFMKKEPKYDLKNFKLIESDVKKIAY